LTPVTDVVALRTAELFQSNATRCWKKTLNGASCEKGKDSQENVVAAMNTTMAKYVR
jgi:hypothetical protein